MVSVIKKCNRSRGRRLVFWIGFEQTWCWNGYV